ncbi:FAD-binding protein [Synechococcus moorigangaii CMS01]|nr:FAD-binding protein [Synechococcus moorigangaii CMS01]
MEKVMLDVAIVGAGLAGIYCGRQLQKRGLKIALFDKSRGIGGRLATRRVQDHPLDHGLSYWEVSGPHTAALTAALQGENILQPWLVATTDSSHPQAWQTLTGEPQWMAPAGMTAIAKYLARDLTIYRSQRLIRLEERTDHWQLMFEQGKTVQAQQVVLALPLPQVITLTYSFITVRDRLWSFSYTPALSLMVGYDQLNLNFPWQALRLNGHPLWHLLSREGEKRSPKQPTLVLQTTGNFARDHLEATDLTPATAVLLESLQNLLPLPKPLWWQLHRWRYAIPETNYGQSHYKFPTHLPLIACGDWCFGQGTEGAIASGLAVGDLLVA